MKQNLGITLDRREEDLLAENILRNSFKNGQSRGSIVSAGLQADRGLLADIHGVLANEGLKVTEVFSSFKRCLLYTSPSPRDQRGSRMPSSA